MCEFYAETLACGLIRGANTTRIIVLFYMESHYTPHCLQQGVTDESGESFLKTIFEGLPRL